MKHYHWKCLRRSPIKIVLGSRIIKWSVGPIASSSLFVRESVNPHDL
jgi:hypothetical protein